jgi:hypothetical protein
MTLEESRNDPSTTTTTMSKNILTRMTVEGATLMTPRTLFLHPHPHHWEEEIKVKAPRYHHLVGGGERRHYLI